MLCRWLLTVVVAVLLSFGNSSTIIATALELGCDPCITRANYRIKVITHGTDNDPFWWNVRAAMTQAGEDMGIHLELNLYTPYEFSGSRMAQDIKAASNATGADQWDALIVSIVDETVQDAVTNATLLGIPVFAMNNGLDVVDKIPDLLGFVGQAEFQAGVEAAWQFIQHVNTTNQPQPQQQSAELKALFVDHAFGNPATRARYQGFYDTLHKELGIVPQIIAVDSSNRYDLVQKLLPAFEACPYDIILFAGSAVIDVGFAALQDNGCAAGGHNNNSNNGNTTLFGVFDESDAIFQGIQDGTVLFTISQQTYLQSVLPVMLATIYVTTGFKPSLPNASKIYQSGPMVINRDNLPSELEQTCASDAFPVCPNKLAPNGNSLSNCPCSNRQMLRIGGVLHGVTTDPFWDVVFQAAETAANDMGVFLDLVRFEPDGGDDAVHRKMADRIRLLCQSDNVDAVFVSLPSDIVVQAVRDACLPRNVPMISVNSGADASQELGLLQHIGMVEYHAGYGAGQRLLQEGMTEGYCITCEEDNSALVQRCNGFQDAIADEATKGSDQVVFAGSLTVPREDSDTFRFIVENAVGANRTDWTGVGLLQLGLQTLPAALAVKQKYPESLLGSFDFSELSNHALAAGELLFAIDQQSYLQGALPVYLLSYGAYTNHQHLVNPLLQTGPRFIEQPKTAADEACEANLFQVCPPYPPEDMNFISQALIIVGYVLVAVVVVISIVAFVWMLANYKTSVIVRVSQPIFLSLVLLGGVVSTTSIIPLGRQTGYRFTVSNETAFVRSSAFESDNTLITSSQVVEENPEISAVDAACMATNWLFGIGFAFIFSALFAKIWRVKAIYQAGVTFKRKAVRTVDVLGILLAVSAVEVSLLVSWQLVSPDRWEREVVREMDGVPIESVGKCTSEDGWKFLVAIVCFHGLCLFYALVLCWQTKDIPPEFAETSNIFLSVICMYQILVIAVPIVILVNGASDIYYFVRTCAIFLQNFTVVVLIFAPKIYRVSFLKQDIKCVASHLRQSIRVARGDVDSSKQLAFSKGGLDENSAPFAFNKDESSVRFATNRRGCLDLDESSTRHTVNQSGCAVDEIAPFLLTENREPPIRRHSYSGTTACVLTPDAGTTICTVCGESFRCWNCGRTDEQRAELLSLKLAGKASESGSSPGMPSSAPSLSSVNEEAGPPNLPQKQSSVNPPSPITGHTTQVSRPPSQLHLSTIIDRPSMELGSQDVSEPDAYAALFRSQDIASGKKLGADKLKFPVFDKPPAKAKNSRSIDSRPPLNGSKKSSDGAVKLPTFFSRPLNMVASHSVPDVDQPPGMPKRESTDVENSVADPPENHSGFLSRPGS